MLEEKWRLAMLLLWAVRVNTFKHQSCARGIRSTNSGHAAASLVRHENIPALHVSDWPVMRICWVGSVQVRAGGRLWEALGRTLPPKEERSMPLQWTVEELEQLQVGVREDIPNMGANHRGEESLFP
eukprot:1187210-Prorocentrum_minimum.AAC.1